MARMANPHDALASLEQAIASGELRPQRGEIDPTLGVLVDRPNGELRLTYIRLLRGKVVALLMVIQCEPVDGERCYNLGWAVAEGSRGQGKAKEIVRAGLAELAQGLKGAGIDAFYVEAIVGRENLASLGVAEKTFNSRGEDGIDTASGVPMRQFLMRVS